MMPLTFAIKNEPYKIIKINGRDESRRHLNNLGFIEDGIVEIVSEMAGNFIISIKDSRIALSKEMAARIVVDNI